MSAASDGGGAKGVRPSVIPPEITQVMGAEPTDEQWRAISMPLEPYVVVAGAGSGKTSVMAARIVYLALVALGRIDADHDGVLPGSILCLTFTNKATENLILRVRRALAGLDLPEGEEPEIMNYHGLAAQILERHGLMAGFESGRRIVTPAQRAELAARVLDRVTFQHVKAEWQPTLITKILNLSDQLANHCVTAEESIAHDEANLDRYRKGPGTRVYPTALERIEIARAVAVFDELKKEMGVIDFGDQITHALTVAEQHPTVRDDYRGRFQAALLDEYQDTNVAQARLIENLFGDAFPVTAVGDPDQNIYAWRGASLFNLLHFPQQFRLGDGSESPKLPLYTNFRSGSHILAAADTIIAPIPSKLRPDHDKTLIPWERSGEGEVTIARHPDEWTEACAIADRIVQLHQAGEPWSANAVLCRKSRLFGPIGEALAERGVPVEIIGLAGLLKLPEVQEVLAYARAAADPFAGVSLARILMGPRYRIGFKDLARVAAWAKDKNYAIRDEDEEESAPFLFAEALEHLDDVEGLSTEGRARLDEFHAELAELRDESRRPVGEFLAQVIRRCGLLAELDAMDDQAVAAATKRNLAAFLDEVHAFSPVEGDLTLRAFLDYVATVEEAERPEWSSVQPSEDDSVKVMTIHVAKGLEFDDVFVPGFAHALLPDPMVQQNPARRGYSMSFDLRGDKEILPQLTGTLKDFEAALKDQELFEERRTCYVALTRARKRLLVSGAWWYGDDTQNAKKPSAFFGELAEWARESGLASVDGADDDPPEENPLIGYRERFVRPWPGPAFATPEDPAFPDGWRHAALEAAEAGGAQVPLVDALPAAERQEYERLAGHHRTLALHLREREADVPEEPARPASVSPSSLRDYEQCPKRFYWRVVRPLPSFSGPAARIGTEVHAWIEKRSMGQTTLLELDETPDMTTEELAGEPGKVDRLKDAFLASRFADATPLWAERPFLLHIDGFSVGGRIDAIYGTADGPWEIVDYKTGKAPSDPDDPLVWLQVEVYALACMEVWGKRPEDLAMTYLYLGEGAEVLSRSAGSAEEIRARVSTSLKGIGAAAYEPTPGPFCRWCDFLPFCDPGKGFMADSEA